MSPDPIVDPEGFIRANAHKMSASQISKATALSIRTVQRRLKKRVRYESYAAGVVKLGKLEVTVWRKRAKKA